MKLNTEHNKIICTDVLEAVLKHEKVLVAIASDNKTIKNKLKSLFLITKRHEKPEFQKYLVWIANQLFDFSKYSENYKKYEQATENWDKLSEEVKQNITNTLTPKEDKRDEKLLKTVQALLGVNKRTTQENHYRQCFRMLQHYYSTDFLKAVQKYNTEIF